MKISEMFSNKFQIKIKINSIKMIVFALKYTVFFLLKFSHFTLLIVKDPSALLGDL